MDNFLTPVDTNTRFVGGPLATFESTAENLLHAGLLRPQEVPGTAFRSNTRSGCQDYVVTAYRLKSGRIRLTISKSLIAARRDARFSAFLNTVTSIGVSA